MNYKKIYDQLIEHAQYSPRPQETGEEHHIVPRCMGGGEEASNKVYLSTHEHIWAHVWLAQIYPDVFGLQLTVSMVVFGGNKDLGRFPTKAQVRDSAEARERAREQNSRRLKGNTLRLGKSHSEETKRRMSEVHRGENHEMFGKSHSEETKRRMSENNGMRGKPPWLNPSALRSPKSLQVWYNADSYFELWEEHQCGGMKLAKLLKASYSKAHQSLVLKFRGGWVPNEDTEWLQFKNNQEQKI